MGICCMGAETCKSALSLSSLACDKIEHTSRSLLGSLAGIIFAGEHDRHLSSLEAVHGCCAVSILQGSLCSNYMYVILILLSLDVNWCV